MADYNQYRIQLSEILTKHGFGWVVDQSESQIVAGREAEKLVSESRFTSDPDNNGRIARRGSARLVTSEPYSDGEKLDILLRAIEAALIQRSLIEQEAVRIIPEFASAKFVSDTSLGEDIEKFSNHQLNGELIDDSANIRSQVIGVLQKIRVEIRGGQ